MTFLSRRLLLGSAAGMTAAGLLAGCADRSVPASAPSSPPAIAPVTIDHAYGRTTLDAIPERVVSLNTQWTSALLALGVQPVGHDRDSSEVLPWENELSPYVAVLDVTNGAPVEKIAALKPDLIMATWAVADRAVYDKLSRVAPVIPQVGTDEVASWQSMTAVTGRVLRQESQAATLVTEVEVAQLARDLPGLAGKSYALANDLVGDQLVVVADPKDGSSLLFDALGMELFPPLLTESKGGSGRIGVSTERVDLITADLLIMIIQGGKGDPRVDVPGFAKLPAARTGAYDLPDLLDVIALNTPAGYRSPTA